MTAAKPIRRFLLEQENHSNRLEDALAQLKIKRERPIDPDQHVIHQDHRKQTRHAKNEVEDSRPVSASGNRRDDRGLKAEDGDLPPVSDREAGVVGYEEGVKESDAETGQEDRNSHLDFVRLDWVVAGVIHGVKPRFHDRTMRPFAGAINTWEIIWGYVSGQRLRG
ncbi:MAG: hypothetical protein WAL85_07350 [Candidatus Korobacteraceae bacterium]